MYQNGFRQDFKHEGVRGLPIASARRVLNKLALT